MLDMFKKTEKVKLTRETYEKIRNELMALRDLCKSRKEKLTQEINNEQGNIDKLNEKIKEIESLIENLESTKKDLKNNRSTTNAEIKGKKYSLKRTNQFMRRSIKLGRKLDNDFFDTDMSERIDLSIYFVEFDPTFEKKEKSSPKPPQQLNATAYEKAKTHLASEMVSAKAQQQSLQDEIGTYQTKLSDIDASLVENQQAIDKKYGEVSSKKDKISVSKGKIRTNRKRFREEKRKTRRIVKLMNRLENAYSEGELIDFAQFEKVGVKVR